MSSIDERIVQMEFDNSLFDKNVESSIKTLEKLNVALKMDGIDKNLADISSSVNKMDFSKVTNSIDSVQSKFSNLSNFLINGVSSLGSRISRAISGEIDRTIQGAVGSVKRLANDLTIAPINQGFGEYELKMGSVQTIMASTGESLGTVNKYLDELNTYADKTIYSFSDMTSNIGKFTNAGVDLDTAVKAIQGISNAAALAGAGTNEASRAMYNFSQALSMGSVQLVDWKSIENANMATKEFKQTLIDTAVEVGTLTAKGDQFVSTTVNAQGKVSDSFDAIKGFRDSLNHQWITTEVLTKALGKYANESEDVGRRAYEAATKVKTFSQLIDTLKEAVGSGWAKTFELFIGDFEQAKELFTSISDAVGGFIENISNARNDFLEELLGGTTKSAGEVAEAVETAGETIEKVTGTFEEYRKIADEIWHGDWDNGAERMKKLTDAGYDYDAAMQIVNNDAYGWEIDMSKYADTTQEAADATNDAAEATKRFNELSQKSGRELLIESLANTAKAAIAIFRTLGEAWRQVFPAPTVSAVKRILIAFHELSSELIIHGKTVFQLRNIFKGIFSVMRIFTDAAMAAGRIAIPLIVKGALALAKGFLNVVEPVARFVEIIGQAIHESNFFYKLLNGIRAIGHNLFFNIGEGLRGVMDVFGISLPKLSDFREALVNAGNAIAKFIESFKMAPVVAFFRDAFSHIPEIMTNVANAVKGAVEWIQKLINTISRKLKISDALSKLGKIGNLFKGIFTVQTNAIKRFADVVSHGILGIPMGEDSPIQRISSFFSSFASNSVIESVTKKLTSARGTISNFFKSGSFITGIQEAFTNAFSAIGSAAPVIFGKLIDAFSSVSNLIVDAKNKLFEFWNVFKESKGFNSFKASLGSAFSLALEAGIKVRDKVSEIFKGFIDIAKNFKFPKLKLPNIDIKGIADKASEAFGNLAIKIYDVRDRIVEFFKDIKIDVKNPLHKLYTYFSNLSAQGIIDSVSTKVKKAASAIRKFFKDTGIAAKAQNLLVSAFERVRDTAPIVFKGLTNVLSKVGVAILGAKDKIVEFWNAFKDTKGYQIIQDGIVSAFNGVLDFFDKASEKVSGLIKKIFGDAKDFKMPEIDMGNIAQTVSNVVEWISDKFEWLKTKLAWFFLADGTTVGSNALSAIGDFFKSVDWIGIVEGLGNAFSTAKDAIVDFFTTVAGLVFGPDEVQAATLDETTETVESLGEVVEETAGKFDRLDKLAETTKAIVSKVLAVVKPIFVAFTGFKIARGLWGIFDFLKGFGGIFKNADKVLNQTQKAIKRVSKAIAHEINSKAIKNVAIALGILAASMFALGHLTPDQFDVAVKGLWAITFALIALMGAFSLFFGKGIFGGGEEAGPLQDFAEIMAKFGTKMAKALNKFGIAAVIISFVIAIKTLIGAVKELAAIDTPALRKGGIALAAIGAALYFIVQGLTKSAGDFSFGKGMGIAALMLAISGSVYILAAAVEKLGKMKFGNWVQGIIGVGALIAALGGLVFIADGMDLSGIMPLIGLIAEILAGMLLLSLIPTEKLQNIGTSLGKVFLSIAVLSAAIGYAEGKIAEVSGSKLAGSLFGIGLIIAEVMGGLAALTFLPEDNIAKINQIADGLQTIFNSVALVVAALALFESMDDGGLSGVTSPAAAKTIKVVGIVMGIGLLLGAIDEFLQDIGLIEEGEGLLYKLANIIGRLQAPLTAVGKAIGGLIGGLGAGFVEGLTGSTPEELIDGFMSELKTFPETIQGWVDGITKLIEDTKAAYEDGKIDKSVIDDFAEIIESVKTMSEDIWAIADTLWNTRVNREAYATTTESGAPDLLLGGQSMTEWLTAWATAFSGFADTIAGTTLDPTSATEKFANVTTLLTSFQGVLTAANDLEGMEEATAKIEQLPAVGAALVRYSWSMLLLNPAAVENTENAVNIINAAAGAAIKNGQKSIDGFTAIVGAGSALAQMSADLPGFGTALKAFCAEVDGMEAYNDIMPSVEATGNIINSLSAGAIANGQQNMTIPDGFTGFVSALSSISADLPGFGAGLKGFAENVDGLQEHAGAVEASKVAAGIINSLAGEGVTVGQNNIISGIGSDGNLITALSTYSGDLEGFATALTVYSAIIDEMKVGAVFKTHAAAAMIVALTNAIPDTSSGLMGLLFGSGDASIDNFTTYLPEIAEAFVKFSKTAEQFDETNAQKVVNAFKTIVETADLLANYSERTGGEMASIESNAAVEMVSSAIEALSFEDLESVQELQDLVTAGEAIGESIKKSLSEGIINGLTKAGEGSTAGGGESAGNSALSKLITSMFGDTKTATAEIENMSIGADISAAIITAIQKGINEPVETAIDLTTFLTAIADGVTAGEDAMISAGETLASAIASGILGARGSASSAGYYTGLSGASGARGAYSAFYSAGSYVGEGYAAGIRSQITAVRNAAAALSAAGQVKTAKSDDSHSPSRVYMKLGSYVGQGYAIGILNSIPFVKDAAEEMSVLSVGSAEDALKNRTDQMFKQASLSIAAAYAYINEVANQSLDSQPVITPVLDMTNLQNGMYSMGSLWNMSLNNPLAYANTTYPGSYQYANTLRANNEYVTQTELRGIRSDLKQLGEAITNMNMVLDSGTLVGQLTPGIDRGLGSIAGMKERWA